MMLAFISVVGYLQVVFGVIVMAAWLARLPDIRHRMWTLLHSIDLMVSNGRGRCTMCVLFPCVIFCLVRWRNMNHYMTGGGLLVVCLRLYILLRV